MKKFIILTVTIVTFVACAEQKAVRVACVGDSITEGYGIEWQSENAYPTKLAEILGDDFEVMNFGRSATTMMRHGDFPYWSAKEFTNCLRYKPDIIVLKLGTNDCKAYQWNKEAYEESYNAMLDTFYSVNPQMRILLTLPVPVMAEGKWTMSDSVIVNGVIPVIKDIANVRNLETIDMYSHFQNRMDLFSDSIHPTAEGAKIMAEIVAKAIIMEN